MGGYDLAKLEEYKYGILGIYINDLKLLQEGNIPISFEKHVDG